MRITNLRLFSLTLLATALNMQSAAAKPSAMARRDSPGFRVLPDELEYEFMKRQVISVNPAPAPPASTPAASPPSQPTPPVVEPPSPSTTDPATSPGGSTIVDSTTPGSTASQPANTDNGSTASGGSQGAGSNTESGTETLAFPLPSDSGSASDSASQSVPTTMSTVSYSLSYGYATVTVSGEESISISSVSISQGYVPAAGPAPIAAPLVVQEAPPDPPPNPVCSIDYLPNDVWTTSGSGTSPPPNSGNGNGTQTAHLPPVSQCNNGTRVSNRIGSQIHLKFYGTEVSLLMVPGMKGGDFDVKIDDEEPETVSNYKPGVSDCQVSTAWNRTGLPNKPHEVTIIVKGSTAGAAAGGSNVEFNGLIFKGPQTGSSSGPNIGLIVGATVGGVVLFAALAALTVVIVKKRRARQANEVHSDTGPASLASPSFRPQTVMSAHSGHTRADSSFSATGYNPSHQSWQQNTAGVGAGAAAGGGMGVYGPVLGHTRQTSDAPLMGMVQGQHSPWQPGSSAMNNNAQIPPGAASPIMGSPHSRPMTMNNGYNNGQDRYSFAPSHNRTTSYGSDGRNPFE